jgi:hypothetical protein
MNARPFLRTSRALLLLCLPLSLRAEDADRAAKGQALLTEIRQKLAMAFAGLEQREIARDMAQVFLEKDERPDLFEPATQEGFN